VNHTQVVVFELLENRRKLIWVFEIELIQVIVVRHIDQAQIKQLFESSIPFLVIDLVVPLRPLTLCLAARFRAASVEFFEVTELHARLLMNFFVVFVHDVVVEERVSLVPLNPSLLHVEELFRLVRLAIVTEFFVAKIQ